MLSHTRGQVHGLRAALRGPTPLIASFLMIPRIEHVELFAACSYQAVVIDLEHGPIGPDALPPLAAAARGAGIFAIARLAGDSESGLAVALDTGVDGIIVPHVGTPEAARRIVAACRFPPDGVRSLNPYVRGLGYGVGAGNSMEVANQRTAVIVMLEGQEAAANVEEIASVDGLDGIFIGAVDLAASLGHPGEPEHPEVVEEVSKLFARLSGVGLAPAVYAPTPSAASRWLGMGAKLVAVSADLAMVARALSQTRLAIEVPTPKSPT